MTQWRTSWEEYGHAHLQWTTDAFLLTLGILIASSTKRLKSQYPGAPGLLSRDFDSQVQKMQSDRPGPM